MRILGIDVGDKTIGVAVSDMLMITANGVGTINRVGIRKDAGRIMDLIKEYDCQKVVVGLPKNLDGSDSVQTMKVYDFKTMLENKLRSSGMSDVTIDFHDERFSTKIAERVLIEADLSRSRRKQVIDKQAAVVILQSYLDQF